MRKAIQTLKTKAVCAALRTRNILASGFFLVIAGTGNVHSVAVVSFSRLKEGSNGGITDA